MKLAKGVEMLELSMNMGGHAMAIHPTVIWDDDNVILIDTGMPGQVEAIREAMNQAGIPFEKLNKIILTHQDIDHIGSLPALLDQSSQNIEVYAHEKDVPYIQGEKPLIKFDPEQMAKRFDSLPEEQRNQARALFAKAPQAHVDTVLKDDDVLPFCGGITVIFTPGHTPGHISLYLNESKTLVTGDAFVSENGKVVGPNVQVTPDMAAATQSLKKFVNFDVENIICYHGGLCNDNANEQLKELANKSF
ncbi:hydrolase [Pullulanibacillus camelliae]|uniref:Hydrolase n=1 Tax=Pullulanibacillus camelliae TaxID=1707096 RepID=A0A8J2YMQ2_9BACL|nr:MBL fold metallo-hydrolase [Pullulanibacillus camelliae]GGE55452.1 hydrolase [Pullulanibacillus camelliae]